VLASASTTDGTWLLGTRDALVLVGPASVGERSAGTTRLPWERVETADWDRDIDRLRVAEVGEFGKVRSVHTFTVRDPGRLLQLVRERVTASVVVQRRVVVAGEITWALEYDAGVDPGEPAVREAADAGLRAAQDELGTVRPPV
jgi:hypothetical protein